MRALLVSFVLALGCSSVETTPPAADAGLDAGCPPKGTKDPDSGLPVGKNCGLDAGHDDGAVPCSTAADCPVPANPCEAPTCASRLCGIALVDRGNNCTTPRGTAGLCVNGACTPAP